MSQTERQERLRMLIKRINKERKRQAAQIDILCNDLIVAQKSFLGRLDGIRFAAEFHKSLLGVNDLQRLLSQAARSIQKEIPGTNVSFFLRQAEGIGLALSERQKNLTVDERFVEDYFHPELADRICKVNESCSMTDLFGLGLEGSPKGFKQISLVTLPLSDLSRPLGFVLLSRPISRPLAASEQRKIGLVTCGLSRAIAGCRIPLHLSG